MGREMRCGLLRPRLTEWGGINFHEIGIWITWSPSLSMSNNNDYCDDI